MARATKAGDRRAARQVTALRRKLKVSAETVEAVVAEKSQFADELAALEARITARQAEKEAAMIAAFSKRTEDAEKRVEQAVKLLQADHATLWGTLENLRRKLDSLSDRQTSLADSKKFATAQLNDLARWRSDLDRWTNAAHEDWELIERRINRVENHLTNQPSTWGAVRAWFKVLWEGPAKHTLETAP